MEQERVKPVIIKNPETGEVMYTLEFNRNTVKAAERAGFKLQDVVDYPMSKTVELFYWALRFHHPRMTMDNAEALFTEIHGMSQDGLVKRLFALYNEPFRALEDGAEDSEKNGSKYAVEL